MASSIELVEWIADQLREAGQVRYRKMFGEYGFYLDDKYFGGVMDNRFLIKMTKAGEKLMPQGPTALPYEGDKPMLLIENLEDREFIRRIVRATVEELPEPVGKPRKAK